MGNLWFGADIDLTNLKQKIQEGNRDVLDALKISYDPSSYQQMVNKLRSDLGSEVFEINVRANTQNIGQNIRQQLSNGGSGLTGGLDDLNEKIRDQTISVARLQERLESLRATYASLRGKGMLLQAGDLRSSIESVRKELAAEKFTLTEFLAQRNALRQSSQDTLLNIRKETAERKNAASIAKKAATESRQAVNQLNSDHLRLNTTLAGGIHISSRLGSALSGLFAVHTARQFLENVIQIGGQLEKQRVSIGAILGDTAKANELFNQIKDLAVKSPFGVVELDQYTKQLAAYGFQQNELFDMTRRLADISAGAGTDISRLANALGHVRSATYLTGITLRQFSMNNIPMLRMLADYYSELEHRVVTTAEVTKRISAKQVSYEDVIEQIKRLTDEGGMFFNMQEKIADTLAAKWKNLHDAMDIMYGDIAESAVGDQLKRLAELLTVLAKNWEKVAVVLGVAGATFGTVKTYMAAQAFLINNLNARTIELALNQGKLTATMIDRYVVEGRITKEQLLRAVAEKKVSVADAELAASTHNVTRAQLEHIAATGRYRGMLAQTSVATSRFTVSQLRMMASLRSGNMNAFVSGFTRIRLGASLAVTSVESLVVALKSLLLNPALISFAAVTAAMEAFMHFKQKNDDLKESIKSVSDTANEGYKNLAETFEGLGDTDAKGLDNASLKRGIDEITEALKNYDPNVNAILREASAIKDLAERYIYLREQLEQTKDAYVEMEATSGLAINANESTGNLLNDTMTENAKDYLDKLGDVRKAEGDLFMYRIQLTQALDYVRNQAFQAERRDAEGRLKPLQEQMRLVFENTEAYNQLYGQIERKGGSFYKTFKVYALSMMDAREVLHNDLLPDTKAFAKYLNESYAGRWGESWKQTSTYQKTAMLEVKKLLESVDGMTDELKNKLMNEIFNTEWHLNIDFDAKEAKRELTELQEYLKNITTSDWVVRVTAESDITSVIGDVEKSIKDINTNMPKIRGAVEAGGFDEGKLKDFGQRLYKESLENQRKRAEKEAQKESQKKPYDMFGQYAQKADEAEESFSHVTDELNRYIDSMQDADAAQKSAARTMVEFYKQTENNNAFKASGFVLDEGNKSKTKGSQKDALLEAARVRFAELKSFLDEYKKYSEVYGKEKSIDLLEKMFPTTQGKGKAIVENFKDVLLEIKNGLNLNTSERKKFGISIDKYIADFDLSEAKKVIDAIIKQLDEEIKAQGKKWDLYKKLLDATGNKKQSSLVAFGNIVSFDNFAEQLQSEIEEGLKKMGKTNVSVNDLLEMDDSQLNAIGIFEKGVDGLYKKLKQLNEERAKLREQDVNGWLEALKASSDYEVELGKIKTKYDRLRQNAKNVNAGDTEGIINGLNKQENKEISDLIWKNFKETEDWGRIFQNLDKMSTTTLSNMLDKLKQIAPSVNDSVEATKALYEAMEKMEDVLGERNPFSALAESLNNASRLRSYKKQAKNGDLVANVELSRLLNVQLGSKVTKNQISDAIKGEESKFVKSIKNIGDKFNAMQDVLQPVIDLFAELGNEDLSSFFQMGNNALGQAANAANGLQALGLDKAGPYGAAAAAALSVASSIVGMHDKAIDKEIEASQQRQEEMERLSKNLQAVLERSLSGVYDLQASESDLKKLDKEVYTKRAVYETKTKQGSSGRMMYMSSLNKPKTVKTIKFLVGYEKVKKSYISAETEAAAKQAQESKTYYDFQKASLMAQRDELKHQMQQEQSKKKTDQKKVAKYKQQIVEMEQQIKDFALEMANTLYEIDVQSWAKELGDALFEAWQRGEDGAEAFKDKVGEIVGDIVKNIITAKIIGKALEPVEDFIAEEMNRTSGELDPVALADGLGRTLGEAISKIGTFLNPVLDATESQLNKYGYSMKEGGDSSLTNAIKGITEETAEILASYLNAIRADVALMTDGQVTYLPMIGEACVRGNILAEQQIIAQRQIAENTLRNAEAAELIYDILHNNVMGGNKFAVA